MEAANLVPVGIVEQVEEAARVGLAPLLIRRCRRGARGLGRPGRACAAAVQGEEACRGRRLFGLRPSRTPLTRRGVLGTTALGQQRQRAAVLLSLLWAAHLAGVVGEECARSSSVVESTLGHVHTHISGSRLAAWARYSHASRGFCLAESTRDAGASLGETASAVPTAGWKYLARLAGTKNLSTLSHTHDSCVFHTTRHKETQKLRHHICLLTTPEIPRNRIVLCRLILLRLPCASLDGSCARLPP